MTYLTWLRFSFESSSLFSKIDRILLQMAQKESKSSFSKCRFLASQVSSGILLAIFSQYLTEILTLRSSRLRSSSSSKGILQFLHSQPGVMFSFLQFLHIFFSLKQRLGCMVLIMVVLFMSLRLIRDIFFFSFSSFSMSSQGYSLLNRMGWQFLLQIWSSSISRSSGAFCFVCVFMCCIICERICSFIFSPYSGARPRASTSSFEKSLGDNLSLDRSQSNLSFIIVFSSRGMSMSMDTSFLSSVSLLSPSLGLLSLSFWRSSLVQGSMTKGRFSVGSAGSGGYTSICYILSKSLICRQWIYQNISMGNSHEGSKVYLPVKTEKVIIHSSYKMALQICSIDQFPHGLDGLRLWEAGIILARYVIHHHSLFKGKKVLELGAGVGVAGLAVKKWTQCSQVDITDYPEKVIENIKRNLQRNGVSCGVFQLDWKKHEINPGQYDIIMGSDVVYFGCPVADLYQVFKERLAPGGIGIIVIPVRKNYAELFVNRIEKDKFDLEVEKLTKEQYFQSPLESEEEGEKHYPLLRQIEFEVYKLTRK